MSRLDLNIDSLALRFTNAAGHEHRIRPIVGRAASIFAERTDAYCQANSSVYGDRNLDALNAAPVNLDLGTMSDEHAAQNIARAWLHALTLNLK
jgi:hypothetical protein